MPWRKEMSIDESLQGVLYSHTLFNNHVITLWLCATCILRQEPGYLYHVQRSRMFFPQGDPSQPPQFFLVTSQWPFSEPPAILFLRIYLLARDPYQRSLAAKYRSLPP